MTSVAGFGKIDRVQRYTDCLQLLLQHGLEPACAGWVTTARLLLRQLKLVPLSLKYPEMEPAFRMLINYCRPSMGPLELKLLCRRAARRAIGHPVAPRLQCITWMPPRLKSYILLEDIGTPDLYSC